MSYRQAAYDEWPRTGIPRLFANELEYQRYVLPRAIRLSNCASLMHVPALSMPCALRSFFESLSSRNVYISRGVTRFVCTMA